jgi:hypothetical protein
MNSTATKATFEKRSGEVCREAKVENGKSGAHTSMCKIMGNHQLVIITRLLEVVETLQTMDELFAWLADMMMQRMDVQVVQFWAMQNYSSGRVGYELRTAAQKNPSLPRHIVLNQPLADTVERLLKKRQSVVPQLVNTLFSPYLGNLLMRYNLNYWAGHFMGSSILLAPAHNDFSCEKVATPLTLAVTIFSQHTPSARLLPTISHILDHALAIAKSHGLLAISPHVPRGVALKSRRYTENHPLRTEFIPCRTQTIIATKRNTLTGSEALIQDKNARRLYLEIDEQKNIGELAYTTQLNIQEFYAALCLLLAQKRIQLFEVKGYPGQRLIGSFIASRATN